MIEPPKSGESTLELWRVVAELVARVNALENMRVAGSTRGQTIQVMLSGAPDAGRYVTLPPQGFTGLLQSNENDSVLNIIS